MMELDTTKTDLKIPAGEHSDSPQALAESLRELPREKKLDLILSLPPAVAGEVLWRTDRASRADIIFRIDNQALDPIIAAMPVDWATHCLRLLPKPGLKRVLATLQPDKAAALKKQLSYNPDTAGARMDPDVTPFNQGLTVAETVNKIRETMSLRKVFHCYVETVGGGSAPETADVRTRYPA
jgi:Mg/Co/Ni transporter MgtE